jgi:hypothetical protein
MLCYEELDLNVPPLAPGFQLPDALTTARLKFLPYEPEQILNPALLRELESLGLKAGPVVLFFKDPGMSGMVHTDLVYTGNCWVKCTCSINWNLSGTAASMSWYDCKDLEECWPLPGEEKGFHRHNGIHYGRRWNKAISPADMRLIESTEITAPTLVRTSLPHQVIVTDRAKSRWCISLRFDPDFETWEAAVKALHPWLRSRRGREAPRAAASADLPIE